jgi:V8-like Glu-specific endopeptidase
VHGIGFASLAVLAAACAPGDADRRVATPSSSTAYDYAPPIALADLPLRRDDPRAQLPRKYLSYPPERTPRVDPTSARAHGPAAPRRTLRYATAKGRVDMLDLPRIAMSPGEEHTPGSYGALAAEGVAPETIPMIVADDVLAWPARAIVKLFITHSDGTTGACSGVMVSRRAVLTAGHCVYERAFCSPTTGVCGPTLGWQREIRAVPGLAGTYMPFGSAAMLVGYANTDWVYDGTSDVGLVVLDRDIGYATGWYVMAPPSNADLTGFAYRLQGYPAEGEFAPGLMQHFFDGSNTTLLGTEQFRCVATNPEGMSGSGVRSINHGVRDLFIAGVDVANELSGGKPTGRSIAERFTSSRIDEITGWMFDTSWLPVHGADYSGWDIRSDNPRTDTPPAVVVRGGSPDRMFLTFRAIETGATWVRPWTATGGWGALENIGGVTTHRPAGVSPAPGFYDAFVRGTNGHIFSKWRGTDGVWRPSQAGWFELPWGAGDVAAAEPAVVSWASNRIDVFIVGVSGGVYWQFWNGAAWSGWAIIGPAEFAYSGTPAAVARGVGLLDVVAYTGGTVGTQGEYVEPAWGTHFSCSGPCTAASDWRFSRNGLPPGAPGVRPSIVASSSTRVDFFVRSYYDSALHTYVEAGVYSVLEEILGLRITDDVAAVSRAAGVIDVFARGADGPVYQSSRYDGATTNWTAWSSLGGDFLGTPVVTSRGSKNIELVGRDTVNRVVGRQWNECTMTAYRCGWTPYAPPVHAF